MAYDTSIFCINLNITTPDSNSKDREALNARFTEPNETLDKTQMSIRTDELLLHSALTDAQAEMADEKLERSEVSGASIQARRIVTFSP